MQLDRPSVAAWHHTTPADCALLRLLTTTPLRASEVIGMNLADLKLEQRLLVLEDGRRYRLPSQTVMSLAT